MQKKYDWKPEKVKVRREEVKLNKKEKLKKEKVKKVKKPSRKVVASPEGGKENAVESWRTIFQKRSAEDQKKQKKNVPKKMNSSVSNTLKTGSIMNWVISTKNSDAL